MPNIGLSDDTQKQRLQDRVDVRTALDQMRRDIDQSGMTDAIDRLESQAINLLTSPAARQAFELKREPDAVRDCYGRHQWGQQCLLARRLVEAGVEIVTTEFDGPLCGRVSNWDDHAVNHHVFDTLAYRAPFVDQAISALIKDIYQRGLDKRVLVIVTGEFGRTPRMSPAAAKALPVHRRELSSPGAIIGRKPALCCSLAAESTPIRSSVLPISAAKPPLHGASGLKIFSRRFTSIWRSISEA